MRVPVVSMEGKPLMPTTPTRARKMMRDGVAVGRFNKLGMFYVQMRIASAIRFWISMPSLLGLTYLPREIHPERTKQN